MRIHVLAGVLLAIAVAVATGCGRFHSVISTSPDGLRVYSWASEWDGVLASCTSLPADGRGLVGTLEGDQASPDDPLWLVGADGQRLSVVWPAGFRVSFEPTIALADDMGRVVAHEGDVVALPDVDPNSGLRTVDGRYIAKGSVHEGCYQFVQ